MALKNLHKISCRLLPGACSCDTSNTLGDFDIKRYNEINKIDVNEESSILLCSEVNIPTRRLKKKKVPEKVDESSNQTESYSWSRLWYRSALMVTVVYQVLYVLAVVSLFSLLYTETIGMNVFGDDKELILTQVVVLYIDLDRNFIISPLLDVSVLGKS